MRTINRNADAPTPTSGAPVTTLLSKGERTAIVDKDNNALIKVHIGAGWDVNSSNAKSYDLDLFALCLGADGKLADANNLHSAVAYYGNKNLPGISCGADNLTGEGEGDDENIQLDLSAISANVASVMIGINIYNGASKNQTFGQVENAFVRYANPAAVIVDLKKFNLTEDYSTNTAVIACKVYRSDSGWKIQAIGEGKNGSIQAIADMYK